MTDMLLPLWGSVTVAGIFGLVIGSFLNVVIWRVPRGESLIPSSRCPQCDAAIRARHNVPVVSWLLLRGRCAHCRSRIRARYPAVEITTAVAFAIVAAWYFTTEGTPFGAGAQETPTLRLIAWWLLLAAYLWFAAVTIALTLIDFDHKRLPDAIVLPTVTVLGVQLSGTAALLGDWPRLLSTLGGGAAVFALYLTIALVYPKGIGGGDVKLAPAIGVVLGSIGWGTVAVGVFAGFLFAAVFGLVLMLVRRASRKTGIAFGPWMLAGAWFGVFWGGEIFAAYLHLVGLN